MENATKALYISGAILISILVISIGVYLFANFSNISSSYDKNKKTTEIQEFNANFTKFIGRRDITIHEIITLANFAKQYEEETGIHIYILVYNVAYDMVEWLETGSIIELIKEKSTTQYTCQEEFWISYDDEGRVDQISFK